MDKQKATDQAKDHATEPVEFKRWQLWAMRLSIISAIAHIPTVFGMIIEFWPL